jgi:hypothetical protein
MYREFSVIKKVDPDAVPVISDLIFLYRLARLFELYEPAGFSRKRNVLNLSTHGHPLGGEWKKDGRDEK